MAPLQTTFIRSEHKDKSAIEQAHAFKLFEWVENDICVQQPHVLSRTMRGGLFFLRAALECFEKSGWTNLARGPQFMLGEAEHALSLDSFDCLTSRTLRSRELVHVVVIIMEKKPPFQHLQKCSHAACILFGRCNDKKPALSDFRFNETEDQVCKQKDRGRSKLFKPVKCFESSCCNTWLQLLQV